MSFLQKIRRLKEKELRNFTLPSRDREKEILSPYEFLERNPVIAEVKLSSPSAGNISQSDPIFVASLYEKAGVGAISVLTDSNFFGGSWELLESIAYRVKVPVLCKEFIISESQIDAAYRLGADIILLIAALLDNEKLSSLSRYAKKLGLYVLLEIHHLSEFERLKNVSFDFIGINSRDLKTLKVDVERAAFIIKHLPKDIFKVAESGIKSGEHIRLLTESGARAFLIGETLMRSADPVSLIKEFNDVYKSVRNNLCR